MDMDSRVVAFTLNGKGDEIGMGVAFSGNGFRPCGGVYACVSFNRREKLRMILGGCGCEEFNYKPPLGYRGVGEAVLEAVEERELLMSKESLLEGLKCREAKEAKDLPKRFLCDFSDGDHGHELMAWAHRYYGSDASVHLGSGRTKQPHVLTKSSSIPAALESSPSSWLDRRLEKLWVQQVESESDAEADLNMEEVRTISSMKEGYNALGQKIVNEIFCETMRAATLLARKLVLHLIVSLGENFDPSTLFSPLLPESLNALRFWRVIEESASLKCAGWVGEAGAMAIAAEALGLGISSSDSSLSRQLACERVAMSPSAELDDLFSLPAGGITQLLSSVLNLNIDSTARPTGISLASSAEASIGSDGGGGVLVFLQKGLQSAVYRSEAVCRLFIAAIRRSVRQLAVVEYDGDDSALGEVLEDDEDLDREANSAGKDGDLKKEGDEVDAASHPDARLASFLTGLLLSNPVQSSVQSCDIILEQLFEAWSVGMLSASLPWRMVCAFTAAGILNKCPGALAPVLDSLPTVRRFYARLPSTVARRLWSERASLPVCSRYAQAMIELLASVRRAIDCKPLDLPDFVHVWESFSVDAATPLPLVRSPDPKQLPTPSWEAEQGWISSDLGWEVWTGTVEYMAVDWKTPSRSAVRTLMDGGVGPPMLREGCTVMRGLDWEEGTNGGDDDGKSMYEDEKARRDSEKKALERRETLESLRSDQESSKATTEATDPTDDLLEDPAVAGSSHESKSGRVEREEGHALEEKKKKKKVPSPKLPLGTVLSIEPWNGIPAMARRVRWLLTGKEGVYRYGGDGGRYDICHVEVNEKTTRVRKRHPLPESAEQCAARHGFGIGKNFNILLRLRRAASVDAESLRHRQGIVEWPDFGAGILVDCTFYPDGSVALLEQELLFGSKDSGWEARFGQPSYVPGTVVRLSPTRPADKTGQAEVDCQSPYQSLYEELRGSGSFLVEHLRNREDGNRLQVTHGINFVRGITACTVRKFEPPLVPSPLPPPIYFDRDYHASSLSISRDGRTVSCVSSDGRGTAFASIGFTKGLHYWEVKLEHADIGSVFIGVAEKPSGSGGSGSSIGYETPPRLNRWHGWGFVNFRATYTAGAERVYGAHCHAGDTVGVLLDCDAGRVSFFFDGLKYGEHILNDLGCAFENLSPFGFNVDGCGSGGAGQGAPSGIEGGRSGRYPAQGAVRPKALWPVIGLRNHGDRVTLSSKWMTGYGVDGVTTVRNILAMDEILSCYSMPVDRNDISGAMDEKTPFFPSWFMREAFSEFRMWQSGTWCRALSRGSGPFRLGTVGLDVQLDSSPIACASASALLGLRHALLAGDRVRLKRSAGRVLELAEEALVLGAFQGRLYYRIISQKSEGGSLTEGGGRAWCWDESEVVDGLEHVTPAKGLGVELPLLDRFCCTSNGGLRIIYEGGAVVRSDLEIFDGSVNLGSIPAKTVIPQKDVLERRVNSCGVVRYRVRYDSVGLGWISSRIRGGNEEAIVVPVHDDSSRVGANVRTPHDCAAEWLENYEKEVLTTEISTDKPNRRLDALEIVNLKEFEELVDQGIFQGFSIEQSDSLLAATVEAVSNYSEEGDATNVPFVEIVDAVEYALSLHGGATAIKTTRGGGANDAAAAVLAGLSVSLPSMRSLLARIAVLRAFNRRARYALPWLPLRPCQEGSAILGGIYGHGASIDRAGRNRDLISKSQWIQVPSIAERIRSLRGLFFSSVKRALLLSITEATTTPTPLSHDEYELPREIRTVRINRLKARRAMSGTDTGSKRKHSVFAQLQNETKSWGGAALRRGFVAKGHGGQKRAFKVKLIGEGVNDYSGPYREVFTDAVSEILHVGQDGRGSLGVLDPTPNNASEIGENRDLFMFSQNGRLMTDFSLSKEGISAEEQRLRNSFSSWMLTRDELSREVEEALFFLGRITGTAFRHGIPLDLPLPMESVWKPIVEEFSSQEQRMKELDILACRQSSKGLHSNLLLWQQKMLNSFVEGLSNVIPVEVLSILSGRELRDILCGNTEVDVDLLRRVVEYEGYQDTDQVISFFWETLRELTNSERKRFLQFVWARNRLPTKESDFDAPFKIQRDSSKSQGDDALPSASTCFFSLALPEYSTKERLKEKLLFAINNVTTMETDFQTNSAEIAEGYRAF